ncbi:RagB/SusD family nutrient uptake outer membrane protein [Sinomicrobium weinanense]|uniref:RagB/SusD family nutrient uptake outer membrane protein n=1 Tax=Sinomicrobium weinanense TaxID=2842200 RepID=A0A926Q316_9FLAO|nr:RagB/SusD family nutrient uptake outer membrane protein [Sinomicrobium weinanense]MBC9797182.1 RagB/SusD family nutrient uptake outer membrane protein [Sinomicrobium weinanense]MBU3125842.1 RagB/SusD family nutrient uptake outer membrane protein [Sinomicrobium weinanense]
MRTRKHLYTLLLVLLSCAILSCEDYLDVDPDFGIAEDDVFSEYESARGYLDNCYEVLLDIHNWQSQYLGRSNINALSDEAGVIFNMSRIVNVINTGSWINRGAEGEIGWTGTGTPSWNQGKVIGNAFYAIRIANKVIERIDDIPNMTQEEYDHLLGQAYFFRAWYTFQVIQRMGGMPRLDKAFGPDDDVDLPRLTYSENSEFIMEDLDKAIALLPGAWEDAEYGRANKVAAMAVKEMAALYAASPLMQNGLESTQYLPYGQEWSERAAEYAHDVLAYIDEGAGGARVRLMNGNEYEFIFYSEGAQVTEESIWYRLDAGKRDQGRGFRVFYLPQYFCGNNTGSDQTAYTNPTQNIVDMFEVLNNGRAYPISDPRSGYDPQNPYANRDPRFYNNILVPGEEWGVNQSGKPIYQELYVGGRDWNRTVNSSWTNARQLSGYMCKKFIWPEANGYSWQYRKYSVNTIYIRVSQVYLDYAEAMNEAYGPDSDPKGYGMTAVDAVNIIRNRVGMPDVRSELTASKETFRDKIRQERAVELMWENHRWHDLRRWMIAEEVFSDPIRGVRANPPAGHKQVTDKSTLDFSYEVTDLTTEQRVFDLKHYWYPMPQADALNLTNLKQNPGW